MQKRTKDDVTWKHKNHLGNSILRERLWRNWKIDIKSIRFDDDKFCLEAFMILLLFCIEFCKSPPILKSFVFCTVPRGQTWAKHLLTETVKLGREDLHERIVWWCCSVCSLATLSESCRDATRRLSDTLYEHPTWVKCVLLVTCIKIVLIISPH